MNLTEFFHSNRKYQNISYIPNFGNAGDALIGLGTLAFLKDNCVKYEICKQPRKAKSDVLVYAGGGAMTGFYSRSESRFTEAIETGKELVVLPHTVKCIPKCFYVKPDMVTIFCREHISYEKVKEEGIFKRVYLDHDMAFFLDDAIGALISESIFSLLLKALSSGGVKDRLRVLKRGREALAIFRKCKNHANKTDSLNCFRIDAEKSDKPLPEHNFDISNGFSLGTETDATIKLTSLLFLKTLNRFKSISTDRLHCCIGASLLRKNVQFSSNNYFKNRAVFDFSIKGRYGEVKWKG